MKHLYRCDVIAYKTLNICRPTGALTLYAAMVWCCCEASVLYRTHRNDTNPKPSVHTPTQQHTHRLKQIAHRESPRATPPSAFIPKNIETVCVARAGRPFKKESTQ